MDPTTRETPPAGGPVPAIGCVAAHTPDQLHRVRALWREFRSWLEARYTGPDRWLLESYFDAPSWENELADLPGEYGPQRRGALILATEGDSTLGVVALRGLDQTTCEMKRMFVTASARGRGIAHHLVDAVVDQARSMGYSRMVLDTGFRQHEAERLYRTHGFDPAEPPYPVDPRLATEGLTFLARSL